MEFGVLKLRIPKMYCLSVAFVYYYYYYYFIIILFGRNGCLGTKDPHVVNCCSQR